MTGYLIKLLRETGPQSFEKILHHLKDVYPILRKPNGRLYGKNVPKSVKAALTANGVFELIEKDRGSNRKLKAARKGEPEKFWRVNEEAAAHFMQQEHHKFVSYFSDLILADTD